MAIVNMRECYRQIPTGSLILLSMTIVFLTGVFNYMYSSVRNDCSMTYMFEYPEFAKIKMPDEVSSAAPRRVTYALSSFTGAAPISPVQPVRLRGGQSLADHEAGPVLRSSGLIPARERRILPAGPVRGIHLPPDVPAVGPAVPIRLLHHRL